MQNFGQLGCRTFGVGLMGKISDIWAVGVMGRRNNGYNIVGLLGKMSDFWDVGVMACLTFGR